MFLLILVVFGLLAFFGFLYFEFIYKNASLVKVKRKLNKFLTQAQKSENAKDLASLWINALSFVVACFEEKKGTDQPMRLSIQALPVFIRLDLQESVLSIYNLAQKIAFGSHCEVTNEEIQKNKKLFNQIFSKLIKELIRSDLNR